MNTGSRQAIQVQNAIAWRYSANDIREFAKQTAVFSFGAPGTNQIVAAPGANKAIVLLEYFIAVTVTGSFKFVDGDGMSVTETVPILLNEPLHDVGVEVKLVTNKSLRLTHTGLLSTAAGRAIYAVIDAA